MKEKIRDKKFIFWCILAFAAVSRLIMLGRVPAGINQDEAMGAMDALALSKYGTDRFGMHLPVHFTAWGNSQMSVGLAYLMIPFIKALGFSAFSIRLPMAIVSIISVAVIYYISEKIFSDKRISLLIMFLTAVNPWHFIQSRWSIDCNLFPHVFLIAFLLLLIGLDKKPFLYISMVFFGLTFYCYGIAVYTVPVFLAVFAIWCLFKKQIKISEVAISGIIFLIIALPEILVMIVNMLHLDTIETPFFTIPFFPESVRSNDILFFNFSFSQLAKNALSMICSAFIQTPDYIFNTIPFFGPLYHISIPFMLIGIIVVFKRCFNKNEEIGIRTKYLALIGFLLSGIWVGLMTFEVNVNRINIIYYPLIIMTAVGIESVCAFFKDSKDKPVRMTIVGAYLIFATAFFICYGTYYREEIKPWFGENFIEAVRYADEMTNTDKLYITSAMETQVNEKMSEILTQFATETDALYYQGKSDESNGRKRISYSERYNYVDMTYVNFGNKGIYVMRNDETIGLPEYAELKYKNNAYSVILID